MAPHDYANTRFSELDQINAGNVGQLQLAWTFSVGADRGQEAAPLVAILAGVGGWPGAIANAELDPRVRNGALGFTGATQDLPAYTKSS
jgi:lanthanide-dependent methanol dehydrogenase